MSLRTTYSAESWEKVYQAFKAVNFTAYDFDTIKQSLLDYTRLYYPEQFNDYIQSSEFIALLELFAYIAEQLAYRVDVVGHENFITTAQRKQSILRLAKLISYKATRNIAVRGLVKINSVTTSERILDSRGVDISGLTIIWNDPNNSNWKEQFLLVMNRVLQSRFGNPQKSFQVDDVIMEMYSLKNDTESFNLGVFPFTASTGIDNFPMEVVPVDIDTNGPFEREPDPNSAMSIIYANDGIGDGSDYTGFLMYVKQGVLQAVDYEIDQQLPNRRIDFLPQNVNDTDVWVQRITNNRISERWKQVDTVAEQNLVFNDIRDTRFKYEVDTLENDQIRVIFGDGDFSDVPFGTFRFWMRQSAGRSITIQKNRIVNQPMSFNFSGLTGNTETCNFTFSLTSTMQNGSATESIEHIRRSAPATYYAQNRMVNGQDYNTYMLKDPTILRLKAINRTFAGQPKYVDWNDASGKYENVKLFGDDLTMRYRLSVDTQTTTVSGQSLIDSIVEPLLSTSGVLNMLIHTSAAELPGVVSTPRRTFIEDNRGARFRDKNGNFVSLVNTSTADGSLKEKTAIQGLIDRHWYGEPLEYVLDSSNVVLARIPDPALFPKDDGKIYAANVPRTIDGVNRYPPGDTGSDLQPTAEQNYFGLRFNRYMQGIGTLTSMLTFPVPTTHLASNGTGGYLNETITVEVLADGVTLAVRSNLRGTMASGQINEQYDFQPPGTSAAVPLFEMTGTNFEQGDAVILDIATGTTTPRSFTGLPPQNHLINLNGWWEIMGALNMPDYDTGIPNELYYTTSDATAPTNLKQHSWIILVRKLTQQNINQSLNSNVIGYEVSVRTLKMTIESPETKFWYNSVSQLMDPDTQKRVYDNIKILRSNINSSGQRLVTSQKYDVVGAIRDDNGTVDIHQLEVVPSDLLNEDSSGDLVADRLLQFENFAANSFEWFAVGTPNVILQNDPVPGQWLPGSLVSNDLQYGRRLRMPSVIGGSTDAGLDFMWQHFSPYTNIIDPSVTNIHDLYLITRGYYDNVISYIRRLSTSAPTPPTPLELRNSYGSLLDNKMLSDTVVLHSGKMRLLFGSLAEPQLRAKFKVVKQGGASLTNERIKEEILNVVNTFFDIDNWDFGQTFYATELISLIHQRLPADVASVVLVPVYTANSFGSLFTVESGHDEILQSAAELGDIEIVDALTSTVIRQS